MSDVYDPIQQRSRPTARMGATLAASVLGLVLVFSACGGEAAEPAATSASPSTASAISEPAATTAVTTAVAPTTTTTPSETTSPTTPSTELPTTTVSDDPTFVSTDRGYSIEVGPTWVQKESKGEADVYWSVGEKHDVLIPATVSVRTYETSGTLQQVLDELVSLASTEWGAEIIDSGLATSPEGSEIAYIEMSFRFPEGPEMHSREVLSVSGNRVAQASFSGSAAQRAAHDPEALPYLDTIMVTS